MTINKANKGIMTGEDLSDRAVMKPTKPERQATSPRSRPMAKVQKPDESQHPWKGGIDKFSEGG